MIRYLRCLPIVPLMFSAGCGGDSPAVDGPAVALLTSGPVSDAGWHAGAYEGLQMIGDSLGVHISHQQTRTPADFDEAFISYAESGYGLIFGHGFEYQDAASRAGEAYPDVTFVVSSGSRPSANVVPIIFGLHEASYLAGMAAGAITASGIVGMVGGVEIPSAKGTFIAFEAGVKAMREDATVLETFIGSWDDVSAAKEAAAAQLRQGADALIHNVDAASFGFFQAVREAREGGAHGVGIRDEPRPERRGPRRDRGERGDQHPADLRANGAGVAGRDAGGAAVYGTRDRRGGFRAEPRAAGGRSADGARADRGSPQADHRGEDRRAEHRLRGAGGGGSGCRGGSAYLLTAMSKRQPSTGGQVTAAVSLRGVTKRFGALRALDGVGFELAPGEIHGLLGENGAGKTTLARVVAGLLAPDAGRVQIGGREVRLGSAAEARALGVAMVHQHFSLVPRFTGFENVALFNAEAWTPRGGVRDDYRGRIEARAAELRLPVQLDVPVERMGVADRQRIEILKALMGETRVLLLDEPTAVLAPQEVEGLFAVLRRVAAAGTGIVLVAHKLDEVLAAAGRVTVLRRGRVGADAGGGRGDGA